MNEHDEVADAELVEEGRLPAIPEDRTPAVRQADEDPDAWLPPEAQEDVQAGIAKATRTAYKRDFDEFAAWCTRVGRRPMPAAAQSVTHYISHLTRAPREKTGRPYGPATLDRVIAAIRTTHRAADHPVPETKGAREVVAGYRKRLGTAKDPAAKPKQATPAKRDVLRAALAKLDRTTLVGQRDAALMLLGHALAARGSELVPLDINSPIPGPDGKGLSFWVYRIKRKMWQKVAVPYDDDPEVCAATAVEALIVSMADEGVTEGPLFVHIDRWGYLNPQQCREGKPIGDPLGRISVEAASDIVDRSMARTGRPGQWSSHSLRRGFVNTSREAGADILDIGRHGGWSDGSKVLLGYVEEADGWSDRNPLAQINKAASKAQEASE
ncbi:integrase [Streptomyces sp. NPDC088348]|uniref:integrase n=1 Tax=Streptomyces sp. NPDC088348 TaxID=3365853 RepID=UPI00383007D9